MYLHEDKGLFFDVVNAASEKLNIPMAVIEKDYYVTMILKLLSSKSENCVFKGGTSLSKCFHLLERFSEDIDITFTEHLGEGRRKTLKYKILRPISEELGLPISNWEKSKVTRIITAIFLHTIHWTVMWKKACIRE